MLRGQQLDAAYKRINILFAGWNPKYSFKQKSSKNKQKQIYTSADPQQFITQQIIYKSFIFAKNLRLLRKKYHQLQNNEQMINRANTYINQIKSHTDVDENIKTIAIISLQNAKQQLKTPRYYIKKMKQQQGRILSWVQNFYDLPNNLQMRHLQKAKPMKGGLEQSIFTEQILRGYYEDYVQTKEIIEEVYHQYMDDKEMIKMFAHQAQNLFTQIIANIKKMSCNSK